MINCALSPTTIEKLFKNMYKHMSEKGAAFNPEEYMAFVYGNKAAASTPETAARLVQYIPTMIINLYTTDFMQMPDFKLDLNALDTIGKRYIDQETGIQSVIEEYKEKSKKFLKALVKTKQDEAGNIEQVDPQDTAIFTPAFSFMPYSSLSGTSQELIAVDPTRADLFIETLDDSKKIAYNTFEKIKKTVGDPETTLDDLTYQGKVLKLKAVPLNTVDQSELDNYTKDLIVKSRSIQKFAKPQVGVTPVDEQVLLVISTTDGEPVYFNIDGDITTKEEGGRIVYQFLRDAKKSGDQYDVRNIYGYKTILDPIEIAGSLYKTTDPGVIENIRQVQQEEFKLLFDLKNNVLYNNERPLLPISGISNGVFEKYVGKRIKLSELAKLSEIDREVFKSIATVQKDRGSFKSGFATIIINGTELVIDRADATADVARQVADVITNKNIDFRVRVDFYNQFFNNTINHTTRRHVTSTNLDKNEFHFNYSNFTYQENKSRKLLDNNIDLSETAVQNLTDAQAKELSDKIYKVLMTGKGKDQSNPSQIFPTKMSFSSALLKNERYMVYDKNTGEIVFADYIEFLKTLPAEITLASADKDIVNTYIQFGVPTIITQSVAKAKEKAETEDKRTPTKKLKDEIVDKIRKEGPQDAVVTKTKSGIHMGKYYANFNVSVNGIETEAKAYFPNKTLLVQKDNKPFRDPLWPSEGQSVILNVRDELAVDGKVYKDVVEVYQVKPDGTQGDYIGSIAERDVTEYTEAVVPEEVEEVELEAESVEPEKTSVVVDDMMNIEIPATPDETKGPAKDLLSRGWKGLNRTTKAYTRNATIKEEVAAEDWWKTSGLNKYIEFEPMFNIVNSDVFARFIVSGQKLMAPGDKLGTIRIYRNGSMVDIYHEAWHAFTQLFLTTEDKRKLYNEMRKFKAKDGSFPYEDMSFLEIEEELAESFRTYAKNPEKYKKVALPFQRSIFQKIMDFLYRLFTGKIRKGARQEYKMVPITNTNYPGMVNEMFNKLYYAGNENADKGLDVKMTQFLNEDKSRTREGLKAKSRFEAIKNGEITAISIDMNKPANKGYKKLKYGDVIKYTDKKTNEPVWLQVTNNYPVVDGTSQRAAEKWSKLTGLKPEIYLNEVIAGFAKDKATHRVVEFKVVMKPEKSFLNKYKPAIENIKWDMLNRGIELAGDPKDDALSRQDSNLVTESIDSALSEISDELNKGFGNKSATIRMFTDPSNREIAYDSVKEIFEERLQELKDSLGSVSLNAFNDINTIDELESNAAAVIRSSKGDHKYVFLANQIEDFTNLQPDTKGGDRIKGQSYFGIKIVGDFYSHKKIISGDGVGADVIIVKNLKDAETQYNNYKKITKSIQALEVKQQPLFKPLSYEEEDILDSIRILQITLDNWTNTIKYHKENSSFDIINEDYTEMESDEVQIDAEGNEVDETSAENGKDSADLKDGSVGKKSLEQLAQKEVLYIVKSLFKISNGKTVNNKLGFKKPADFGRMWKILTRELVGVKDEKVMFEKLTAAANSYAPELKQLIQSKFPNPENITRESEFDILASFWQTFSRPRVPYMQLTAWMKMGYDPMTGEQFVEEITTDVIDASIDASNIIRKFQAQFKAQSLKDNPFISKIENITTLNDLRKLTDTFRDPRNPLELDMNKSFDFAKSIGFMFDDLDVIKNRLKNDRNDYFGLRYVYSIVRDLAAIQEKGMKASKGELDLLSRFTVDPLFVLQMKIKGDILPSLKQKEVYQKNIVKRLAELQGRFGFEGSNYSVMNPEKNLVNEIIDDHSVSRVVDGFNRAANITDLWANKENRDNPLRYMSYLDPRVNTFTNRSQIIKSLFATEADGRKREGKNLKLFIDSGTQIANTDIGTSTTSLDPQSKFLQEMHMMLKGGVQEFIRHASKKSSFGAKVDGGIVGGVGKGNDGNLYVDIDMFMPNRGGEAYAINNIMIPYLASEFERIVKFKQNREEFKKYIGYNNPVGKTESGETIYAGEVFTLFDNVLTEDLKEKLLAPEFIQKFLKSGVPFEQFLKSDPAGLKKDIVTAATSYFTQQASENTQILGLQEFIDEGLFEKIGKTDMPKDLQKAILVKAYTYNAWIHNFETINIFYGDPTQRNHFKENEHKRNTGSTSGGPKFPTSKVAQDFINDLWNAEGRTWGSRLAIEKNDPAYKAFFYDGTINTAVIKDVERVSEYIDEIEAALRADYKKAGKTDAQIEKILEKELKAYKEMNEADGAGYITLDAYRTLKKLENAWGPKQDELYNKIVKGKKVSASDIANFFPVYKLQNYGHLANNTLAPVLSMHKFALMPLIPTMVEGSQLQHLHEEMLRNNIQYVTFESGSKVGSVTSDGKADQVFADDTFTTLKDKIQFTPNTIYLEYLKVATNVNTKYKGTMTFPTQLRGLILDGMFNQGLITKSEYEPLAAEYDEIVSGYTEILKLELLDEIGYELKGGKYVGDLTKFLGMVQKELGNRDIPDHLLRSIGVNPDGSMKTDLSIHLEADTIEKMLLAILTKRLIKQKVKGEPLIQVPSTMFNGKWDVKANRRAATKAEIKKFLGSNNLPFYHPGKNGTNAMKIAIALQGDYVNLLQLMHTDGQVIGTIDRLNEMIKDDQWLDTSNNRKAISLAGARIPIQNLNSMEFAEVWHFLDPTAGNLVVVPTELVAKAGSDFDVDKIFWMMPHIDSRGEYVTGSMSNEEFKNKLKDAEKFEPKPGMKKPSTKAIIQKQKKVLENQLIDITKRILSTPGNYASLVRPNATYLVKDVSDELEEYVVKYNRYKNMHAEPMRMNTKGKKAISPTRVLEVGYNLHKHGVNMGGKDTLGIEALQNKKHPILKSIGAKMPVSYMEPKYDDAQGKYVDGDREFDMRLLMPHNTMQEDGKEHISISNDKNVAGSRIADIYSHVMNGLLDVEADPWVAYIQANIETIGIFNYLLEAGIPEDTAIYFVSNPFVREYVEKQQMLKSTFSTLANKKTVAFQYVKSQAARMVESKLPAAKRFGLLNKINDDALDAAWASLKDTDNVLITLGGSTAQEASFENIKAHLAAGTFTKKQIVSLEKVIGDSDIATKNKELFKRKKSLTGNDNYYDAAKLASEVDGVLDSKGNFSKEGLLDAIKKPNAKENTDLNIAVFLHFIEIEKQIQGLESIKRQSNPDTKLLKTVQQVKKREKQFVDSLDSSKIDPDLPKGLRERSILKSFYLNDLTIDLIEPILPMRLDNRVSDFIAGTLNTSKSQITSKFGQGVDGEERFTTEYNNAVVNFVFQNFMSNFVDSKGNIVEIPDEYRYMPVIIKAGIKNGAEVKDSTVYIDRAQLTKDFTEKLYLRDSNSPNSYANRGLASFKTTDNPFPTQASYNRYVVEREFLRTQYSSENLTEKQLVAYEKFLNQRALINVFNKDIILGTDEYSYTDMVMKMIKSLPDEVKDKYPVLNQISQLPFKGSQKILQLNDQKLVKGDLATTYYQNLRELGDDTVTKLNDPLENQRLSDVFRVFSLMMIHQHGVGYSKYGFVKALDDADYMEVMRSASDIFMNQHVNSNTLSAIYNKLMNDDQFKSYVVDPKAFLATAIPMYANTNNVIQLVDEYILSKGGQESFDKLMNSELTDMTILDIPVNVTREDLDNGSVDDYVQADYNTLNIMFDRLMSNGISPDNIPDLFNDFVTDTQMSMAEFVPWLRAKLESDLEQIPEEDIQPELKEDTDVEEAPTETIIDKPVKKEIPRAQMIFDYGKNKRAGIKATSTFDAVKNGERTATTRYSDSKSFSFWKKFKKGDLVEFVSGDGQTLIAEITVPLHKLSGSGKTPSQWSELEGWSIDYFNTSVRPKLDTAYQIEYKYIPQQKAQATLESSVTDPVKIYVDGSDIKGTGAIGFGAVYKFNGQEYGLSGTEQGEDIKQLQDMFPTMKFSNPTMEMLGLVKTLESFVGTSQHISIFQDYSGAVNYDGLWQKSEGSQQRATKPWKAKEVYTKYLVARAAEAIKQIEAKGGSVKLNWVKGHSGDAMNDAADRFAKDRNNFNNLTTPLSVEQTQLEASILKTSTNSGDYSAIEKLRFDAMEHKAVTGENLISNLASVDDMIDEYIQLYADTMTQEQFVEFKLNCG